MYIVAPNTKEELTPAVKAIVDASEGAMLMNDLQFGKDGGEDEQHTPTNKPNPTVLRYLQAVIAAAVSPQGANLTVPIRDVLADFNHHGMGVYRRTCVVPFMTPFLITGAVELTDAGNSLLIHTRLVAEQIASLTQ